MYVQKQTVPWYNNNNNNRNSSDSNRCDADCVLGDVTLFAAPPTDIYIIATVCHLSFWNVTAIKALSPALTSVSRPHPARFFYQHGDKMIKISVLQLKAEKVKYQTAINSARLSLWCSSLWCTECVRFIWIRCSLKCYDDFESGRTFFVWVQMEKKSSW